MIATGIPSDHLYAVWPDLWPLIEPAYARSKEKGDILAGILSKDLTLFAIYEKTIPVAGIVVKLLRELDGDKQPLQARVWLVGGVRLSDWLPDFLKILIPWARQEGCSSVSGSGRKGWARVAARLGCERIADEDGEPAWRLAI